MARWQNQTLQPGAGEKNSLYRVCKILNFQLQQGRQIFHSGVQQNILHGTGEKKRQQCWSKKLFGEKGENLKKNLPDAGGTKYFARRGRKKHFSDAGGIKYFSRRG